MNRKERLLDIYSDGGEWEDFEPVIDEMETELATLRAQIAESQKANERLVRRLNWIREHPNDGIALEFALKATDEEIDDIKHLVNTD